MIVSGLGVSWPTEFFGCSCLGRAGVAAGDVSLVACHNRRADINGHDAFLLDGSGALVSISDVRVCEGTFPVEF